VFRFEWLSLLTKRRNTNRKPVHVMQIKQLSTGPGDVSEEISEDIQLMRAPVDLINNLRV